MNRRTVFVALCAMQVGFWVPAASAATYPEGMRVVIDPRVELVGIVYRLGGHPEFTQGNVRSYLDDIDEYFAPYRDHPVVKLSQELRKTRGISFDAVMQIALHIDDAFSPAPIRPLNDGSLMLYSTGRWTPPEAERFIRELADFAKTSHFRDFYDRHSAIFEHTRQATQSFIDTRVDQQWLPSFFGVVPTGSFTVIPSMINGPASYGPTYRDADGKEHFYAIVGVNTVDDHGMPVIDSESLELVIHEFSHSFVNHLVAARRGSFDAAAGSMYGKVETAMNRMAYNDWETMINESLVRVAVIRYFQSHEGTEAAEEQIQEEVKRSFLWTRELSDLMGTYERHRRQYPTFESFIPQVAAFFTEYAPRLDGIIAERERALEQQRPHVVSMQPANGSRDVDPALRHLVITFDRAMSAGYAIAGAGGEASEKQPTITNFHWNDSGTVVEAEIRLEPGVQYAFSLNTEGYAGFKSSEGVALKPYIVRFRTRPK